MIAAHRMTLFGLIGLIALNSAWHLWLAPSQRFPVWLMLGIFVRNLERLIVDYQVKQVMNK